MKLLQNMIKSTKFWRNNYLILREFKYFKLTAILAIVFTILSAIFEGFGVGFLMSFLQGLIQPDAAAIETGIQWVDKIFLGINQPVNQRIYRISGFILLTTFIRAGFFYISRVFSGHAQAELTHRLHIRIFEQVQALSQKFFTKNRSGALVNTMTTEVTQLKQAIDVISMLIGKAAILAAYFVSMFLISWKLTVLSIMLFALASVAMSTLLKKVRETSFRVTKSNSAYTAVALENLNGVKTVQMFTAQKFERNRIEQVSNQLKQKEKMLCKFRSSLSPISETSATTILIVMLLYAFVKLIPEGELTTTALLTFLFVLFRMIPLIKITSNSRSQFNSLQGSIGNIKEFLKTENKPYIYNGTRRFLGLKTDIKFKSVSFGYEANDLVLHDINLVIEKGKTTALVGGSGAGKTTLVDLIPRFYDPQKGQIYINETSLEDFEINSLRRKIAVVSQDTFIFNTSVTKNIAYGLDNVREEDVWQAAKLANAFGFIQELPEGFETELGDRGTRLSGGQRQRIAIARAILRDPEILILDEATSALDSVTEKLIQKSLEKLVVGKTVIAIAHRLSTIAQADKVVVLEKGRIVEQGDYQSLLTQKGALWKYHQMQYRENENIAS